MARMEITPDMMMAVANEIKKKLEEWDLAVKKIYELHAQMDSMWDGAANQAFNAMFMEDKTKFNNLAAMMQEYQNVIVKAANDYILGEEAAKNIVSRR